MPRFPRPYVALVAASILGPALMIAAVAWWSWNRVQRDASVAITRTVDILAEQGLRLFRIEQLVLRNVDIRVAGLGPADMLAQQAPLHGFLVGEIAQLPEADALFILDRDGELIASSRDSETRLGAAGGAGRAYFKAAAARAGFIVDAPSVSSRTGQTIIHIARRLTVPDGSFNGVAVVALRTSQMEQGWSEVAARGDAIAVIRDDGQFLARYPELPPTPVPPRPGAPTLMPRLLSATSGLFDADALSFDGIARRVGFRKLTPYPVYITYAVDRANIDRQWYVTIGAFALMAVAASAALLLVSFAVFRRGRSEAAALARAELSEASQRALFRNAPTAMHALNAERRIIDVNDRWLELFGYAREEIIGRIVNDLYAAVDAAERAARWQEIIGQGAVRDSERRCIRRSGEQFQALISATIVHDAVGRFSHVITTVTDITEKKRAEAAAQHARNFAELLIESSIDGIVVKDLALRYTVWNRSMEEMTGKRRDEVLGLTSSGIFPRIADSPFDNAWQDALGGRTTTLASQTYFLDSGRTGLVDQTIAPLRAADGTILGALAVVRDVTERRRLEDMMRQAQKMEAVGQLTGGIAHDFNNLLTIILGNLEALQARDLDDPQAMRFAEAAQRGAERAATLTQRLLAFSRRQPLDPRPLEPNRLVAAMSDMLRRALGEQVAIETVLAGGLWRISVDGNQLESALLNLAVNARDAMPEGGRVTIETANTRLDDDYAGANEDVIAGQYVMIAVSDSGCGMSDEVQARAFEPFYTTKDTGRGSGLGLSQVYGFVKQSGGHVKIYSEVGEGTTVRLYLPRLGGDGASLPLPVAAEHADPPAPGSGTILVVEDDDEVREHTARLLRDLGYRVVEAADGGAALHALDGEDEVDLLFTDVGLPGGINGRQLADEAARRRPGLKLLFTTGYARDAIFHQGRLEPGLQLIVKPFTFAGLAAKVRQVLGGA